MYHTKNDRESLRQQLQVRMRIISVIMSIPVTGVIVLGDQFYKLWLQGEDRSLLYV